MVPKSSTELNVTWDSPAKDLWNGNLLGYNVGYMEISDSALQSTLNSTSSPLQYNMKTVDIGSDFGGHTIITGLNMFAMYSVIVQAFNSRGPGPFSDPVSTRTDEGGEIKILQFEEFVLFENFMELRDFLQYQVYRRKVLSV